MTTTFRFSNERRSTGKLYVLFEFVEVRNKCAYRHTIHLLRFSTNLNGAYHFPAERRLNDNLNEPFHLKLQKMYLLFISSTWKDK